MQRLTNYFLLIKVLGPLRAKRFNKSKNSLPSLDFETKNEIAVQLGLSEKPKTRKIAWYTVPATTFAVLLALLFISVPHKKQAGTFSNNSSGSTISRVENNINSQTIDNPETPATQIIPEPTTIVATPNPTTPNINAESATTQEIATEKTENILDQLSQATSASPEEDDSSAETAQQPTTDQKTKTASTKSPQKTKKTSKKSSTNILKKYFKNYKDKITNWREIEF